MTDADDLTSYYLERGVFEMNDKTGDLAKRASKAAFGKAAHHLMKAGQANADCMKCMGKLAGMHGAFVRKLAAGELGKAEGDGFDHAGAMKLIQEAHGHATEAGDHMEMANVALGKAGGSEDTAANATAGDRANGTVIGEYGGADVEGVDAGTRTEGTVPWYSATDPYPGKAARTAGDVPPAGFFSKAQVDLMVENARLKAQVDGFAKTPVGVFKGRTAMSQPGAEVIGADGEGDLGTLMKGIDHVDQNDPSSVTAAAGRMIGNMLANSRKFGKSVFDPSFRGGAGLKRTNG